MKIIMTLFFLLLISMETQANDTNGNKNNPTENLLVALEKIFPNSLKQHTPKIYEFCPDNTCIKFTSKKSFNTPVLVFIYLFYEGDYYDLEKWRNFEGVKQSLHQVLIEQKLDHCYNELKINHACLKMGFRHAKVKVENVRYDEDYKSVTKVW